MRRRLVTKYGQKVFAAVRTFHVVNTLRQANLALQVSASSIQILVRREKGFPFLPVFQF